MRALAPIVLAAIALAAGCSEKEARTETPYTLAEPVPLRQMTSRAMFGGMPLTNRFLSPQFSAIDAVGWLPYSDSMMQWPTIVRAFLPHTPLDQPALYFSKALSPPNPGALGAAKSMPGPIEVSLWAGRKSTDADTGMMLVRARLLGLYTDGTDGAVDLAAGRQTAELDDMTWVRLAATVPDGPVGLVYLDVSDDDAGSDLYISSPILVAAPSPRPLAKLATRRPLNDAEHRHLELARDQLRDRIMAPPARQTRLGMLPR